VAWPTVPEESVTHSSVTERRQIAMSSPSLFVFLALVAYAVAYFVYGRWYDRQVWAPDGGRTTPAHMYMDGVEYFPTSRYVLWGYQFKSVAALGPILGPFIALQYGWLPALIWIIVGNFFIGWMQDYSAIMVSVRNRGRSFGPIAYEFTGAKGRSNLLGFVLAYLLIISAAFIFLIATFWNIFPGTFLATIGITLTGVLAGWLLYRRRMNVGLVTLLSVALVILSVVIGTLSKNVDCAVLPHSGPRCEGVAGAVTFGLWNIPFWAVIAAVFLYLAAVLPLPKFIQPINYVAFFPAFAAIILILVGALISPVTDVALQQPAWKAAYTDLAGPIWPILFVAIACGAISGWHSLVGSSSTSKQLDVETDAFPVGAGAMLSEGLLALASLAAYMVLASNEAAIGNIGAWVNGSVRLTEPFLGGEGAVSFLTVFFGFTLVIYAITVMGLVTRFWRLVSAEVFGERQALRVLGQKHVATAVGLAIPVLFATTGSWYNLWLYFGGSNQLLAGLALMLVTIHLARQRKATRYTLWPAVFMIVTTLAALAWQTWIFFRAILRDKPLVQAGTPIADPDFSWLALTFNGIFVLVGLVLLVLGVRMALFTVKGYRAGRALGGEAPAQPAPAGGGGAS
jgi:carbon starvation protein